MSKAFFLPMVMGQQAHAGMIHEGNFWQRCLLMIEGLVRSPNVVIRHQTQPQRSDTELVDVAMDWFFPERRLPKGSAEVRDNAKARAEDLKAEWKLMMNGGVHLSAHTGQCVITHCCTGRCGCQNELHSRQRIHLLLAKINYSRRPCIGQLTEWTKVRDAAKFHALNVFTGNVGACLSICKEMF